MNCGQLLSENFVCLKTAVQGLPLLPLCLVTVQDLAEWKQGTAPILLPEGARAWRQMLEQQPLALGAASLKDLQIA